MHYDENVILTKISFFQAFCCTLTMKIFITEMNDYEAKDALFKPYTDPSFESSGNVFAYFPVK